MIRIIFCGGIQGNWLARLESWSWEGQCPHSKGGVGMLQLERNLIVMSEHFWKGDDRGNVGECVFFFGSPCFGKRWLLS